MVSWQDALKLHARKSGKHVIPRKGTLEYDKVKELMTGGAYGADSVRCTDKAIRVGRKGTAGVCFDIGKRVGFRAGILKGQRQAQAQAQRPPTPPPQRPPLETMSSRALADLARQNGVSGYYNMRKSQLMEALLPIYGPPPQ